MVWRRKDHNSRGYSIQYQRITVREDILAPASGGNTRDQQAAITDADIASIIATRAVNFTDLSTLVPRLPAVAPGLATPVYARGASFAAYDPSLDNPYVQNLTLSVSRNISRNSTLDVRYTGTLARKQIGGMDLNTNTVMYNPELFNALQVTRAGGDDPLFDQMFAGIRLSGVPATVPVVNGTTSRGIGTTAAEHDHASKSRQRGFPGGGQCFDHFHDRCGRFRNHRLDPGTCIFSSAQRCDRLALGLVNIPTRCFPENYLTSNPQLSGATFIGNFAKSSYHGMQVSYTMRPSNGLSVQTTYSWSKSMQLGGGAGPELPIRARLAVPPIRTAKSGSWTACAVSKVCIVCWQTGPTRCRSVLTNL
jgi:hypothetical protein